ncbi:RICIN domain-containing protein [Dactylosporangium cerinum]|uniref:RICIN domain-containing protein n=1 Tax=Dactylosporangium cerinum TaxID=1434730 RepID=A0ABV9VRA7_9ACTN
MTSIDPAAWYQVINTNSGKCLDDADRGTANGTVLQQWTCGVPAAGNQQWQFRPTGNGYYQVVSRHATNLVWDVNGGAGATGDGTQVHLWAYVGGTNQQWQPVHLGNGLYRFTARNSGKCLDVRDVSTADGAWLQQWTCTSGPAQTFRLRP